MSITEKFADWFDELVKDDRTIKEESQSQGSRCRRLSKGGNSRTLLKTSSTWSREIIKDDQHDSCTFPRLDLKQNSTSRIEEDRSIPKRKAKWSKERELPASERKKLALLAAQANFENKVYNESLHFRISHDSNFVKLKPGTGFFPIIAEMLLNQKKNEKTLHIPATFVFGFTETTMKKKYFDGIFMKKYGGLTTCETVEGTQNDLIPNWLIEEFVSSNQISQVSSQLNSQFPLAVCKRQYVDSKGVYRSALTFLYRREQIINEILQNRSGVTLIQKFVKSKGSKPWIIRAQWQNQIGCKKVWALTSTSDYWKQKENIHNPPRVGEVWVAQEGNTTEFQRSNIRSSGKICEIYSEPDSPARVYNGCFTYQLCTNTSYPSRCNIVSVSSSSWQAPSNLVTDLVKSLEKSAKLQLRELSADFIQDENGTWWMLQVKAFSLHESADTSTLTIPVFGIERSILVLTPKENRASVKSKPKPCIQNTIPLSKSKAFEKKCSGEYCDPTHDSKQSEASKELKSMPINGILYREILLDKAQHRYLKQENSRGNVKTTADLIDSDLEKYFTRREANEQFNIVSICDTCFYYYSKLSEKREKNRKRRENRKFHGSKKSRKACGRLYERFIDREKSKNKYKLEMIISDFNPCCTCEENCTCHKKSKVRKKRKKRKSERLKRKKTIHSEGEKTVLYHLTPGDRVALVADNQKEGTVIQIHSQANNGTELKDFGLYTVKLDNGEILEDIQRGSLVCIEAHNTASVGLSADELISFGPLPPLVGKKDDERSEISSCSSDYYDSSSVDSHGSDYEEDELRLVDEDNALSFLPKDEGGGNPELSESEIVCPFGCGEKLSAPIGGLASTHKAWQEHIKICARVSESFSKMNID